MSIPRACVPRHSLKWISLCNGTLCISLLFFFLWILNRKILIQRGINKAEAVSSSAGKQWATLTVKSGACGWTCAVFPTLLQSEVQILWRDFAPGLKRPPSEGAPALPRWSPSGFICGRVLHRRSSTQADEAASLLALILIIHPQWQWHLVVWEHLHFVCFLFFLLQ